MLQTLLTSSRHPPPPSAVSASQVVLRAQVLANVALVEHDHAAGVHLAALAGGLCGHAKACRRPASALTRLQLACAGGRSCVAGTSSTGTPPPPCTGHAQVCTGPCTCPGTAARGRGGRPASARPQGRTKRHIGHGVHDDACVCGRGLRDAPQAALQHVVAVQVLHLRRRLHPHLRARMSAARLARGWAARSAPGRHRKSRCARRSGGAGRPPAAGEKGCQHAYARD